MKRRSCYGVCAAMALAAALLCGCAHQNEALASEDAKATTRPAIPHNFDKWEREIAAYEAADRTNPPPRGASLFTGSSTIRMWQSLASDFPEHKVINRGFGGSELADATHFADRIIFPYEPKQIFLRSGGNDIHNGRLPEEVANDFAEFVRKIRTRLPNAEIIFIGWSPSPSRWGEVDKDERLNSLVRSMALHMPRVSYIDCSDMTLSPDKLKARRELFVADQLHFNADGYKLLAERVRPYLPVIVK